MEQVIYSEWILTVDTVWADRWQLYRRLMELNIPCKCSTGKPLAVTVATPTAAIQVWSVVRQQSADRSQRINWLDRCFDLQRSELLYD